MFQSRVRISSTHRHAPSPSQVSSARDANRLTERARIQASIREEQKRRKALESAFEGAMQRRVARILSTDGILRTVAAELARGPIGSVRIIGFPKILYRYCSMLLGYEDRHVVEECLLVKMKRLFTEISLNFQPDIALALKHTKGMTPKQRSSFVRMQCAELTLTYVDDLGRTALNAFEHELLELAEKGRRSRREHRRGVVVFARVHGLGRMVEAALILDRFGEGCTIKAFQKASKFNRVHRRPQKRSGELRGVPYDRRPKTRLH